MQQRLQQRRQLTAILLLIPLLQLHHLISAHPQYRQLKCVTPDGLLRGGADLAKCHLVLKDLEEETPGRPAPEGDGCFTEIVNNEERIYCDLVCPKAHTIFHAAIDQGHRACFNYFTYQLEKRQNEWFLWRSGKCLNSTVSFTIGCKFDDPFRTQFASDNDVFEKLKTRVSRKLL